MLSETTTATAHAEIVTLTGAPLRDLPAHVTPCPDEWPVMAWGQA